jgi:hypothetical protein
MGHSFPQIFCPLATNVIGNNELEKSFKAEKTQTGEEQKVHVDVSSSNVHHESK